MAKVTSSGESRPSKIPAFVEPQLATAATKPPSGNGWLHEVKLDGYRLLARIDRGRVRLKTRSGLDWTDKFPTVEKALKALPTFAALLDGEVVAETASGAPSFSDLQADLAEGRADRFRYYVFDLLHLDGADLTNKPLVERKQMLEGLLAKNKNPFLRYHDHFTGRGDVVLKHACRLSLEGIISKLANAPYRSGRSKAWLKSKCLAGGEFIIIGYVPSTTQRRAIGSLVLGYFDGGTLVYAGRVGSGFSSSVSEDLWRQLEGIRSNAPELARRLPSEAKRNVLWTSPELVAEVDLRGWTADGILRHAVFKGLRQDKEAVSITRDDLGPLKAVPTKTGKPRRGGISSSVVLTHPDRVLWPGAGITKQGLADFYEEVWPWISSHVTNRPLALVRCPQGMEGDCFFQKHGWTSSDRYIVRSEDTRGKEELLAIKDLDGLLSLVQASVLEIHVWGATLAELDKPDGMTFDIDPDPALPWSEVASAAVEIRERLASYRLSAFVKTSGGKGLHVYCPLRPAADWARVKGFAQVLADSMAKDSPQKYLATASKTARRGRIFIDYLRNSRGATAVAAYSTRARMGATISTPIGWEELGPEMRPDRFTLPNLLNRLRGLDDPWQNLRKRARPLPV